MQELNPKEILDTISKIELLAEKLDTLLPGEVIMEAPIEGGRSLLRIRGLVIDLSHAIKLASGAILHLRQMLDEQEAEI